MGTWIFPMENYLDFSNSILPVLIALLVFMVIRKLRPGKPTVISVLFGFLFSICMVFGAQLDQKGSVPFMNPWMWLSILAFAVVMTLMVSGLWSAMAQRLRAQVNMPRLKASREICRVSETQTGRMEGGSSFLLRTGGVIFLLYFVVFLAVYPGFFVYDAQEEYLEVVTRSFTTHHPLFHVLMLGGIVQLVYKLTGSINLGIAAYTLFQMAALSLIFGYFIWKLGELGLRKRGQWILTLYLGICPPLVMFSLCSAKDGLITPDDTVTEEEISALEKALQPAGLLMQMPEDKIDAGSAVSGCGPAFVYLFLDALANGGVSCGLPYPQALALAAQTMIGAAEMALCLRQAPRKAPVRGMQPRRNDDRRRPRAGTARRPRRCHGRRDRRLRTHLRAGRTLEPE